MLTIDQLLLTPLKVVHHPKGDVYHAIKKSSPGFCGFGEAYFSTITQHMIKGWKRHNQLTLNLVVPCGAIRFVIFDDRPQSPTNGQYNSVVLGLAYQYARLTIPPRLWVAFQGLDVSNLLMNVIANEHDSQEADNMPLEQIPYDWSSATQVIA